MHLEASIFQKFPILAHKADEYLPQENHQLTKYSKINQEVLFHSSPDYLFQKYADL